MKQMIAGISLKLITLQAGLDLGAEFLIRHAFEQKLKPFSGFVD